MKRREFLLGAAAVAGMGLAPRGAAADAHKKGLKFGVTTYQIGSKWTIPELIEHLPKLGVYGVELRTDMKFAHGIELGDGKAQRLEAGKRFADSPLKLVGIACGERYDSPDPKKLEKAITRTRDLMQFCVDMGAPSLRVFPNDFHKEVPHEKTLAQIAEALKKLATAADGLGVELRLEAHGSAGLLPNLAAIAKAVNHPRVRAMPNSDIRDLKGEGLSANLESVKPYLASVIHIHNMLAKEYVEAKYYETQFAFLKNAGWDGWCLLEIGDKPDNPARFAEIARQKKRWDELVSSLYSDHIRD